MCGFGKYTKEEMEELKLVITALTGITPKEAMERRFRGDEC